MATTAEPVLDPVDFLLDCLHYHHKLAPGRTRAGRWPLGTPAAASAAAAAAAPPPPPSLAAAILRDFTAIDGYQTHLPLFKPVSKPAVKLLRDAWTRALPQVSSTTATNDEPLPDLSTIPLSTVEHDNTQLQWHRQGVPLCDYGDECDACSLYGHQGPLHAYLTPAQQRAFEGPTKHLPEGPYFCLLCIRRDLHALQLAHTATCHPPLQTSGRPVLVLPPFQNIVDAPGGYIKAVVLDTFAPMPVAVVGVSGTCTVKYDPGKKRWFVDQGAMVFQGTASHPGGDF